MSRKDLSSLSSGSKETSCNIQARSVAAVLVGRIIGYFEAWLTEDSSQRKSCRFWSAVLQAASKTLRDGVASQKGSFQECGEGANEIHEYSSSPWVRLSLLSKKLPLIIPLRVSHMLIIEARLFLLELPVWCPPSPTVDSNRFVVPRGILQLGLFEEAVLWRMLELEV